MPIYKFGGLYLIAKVTHQISKELLTKLIFREVPSSKIYGRFLAPFEISKILRREEDSERKRGAR